MPFSYVQLPGDGSNTNFNFTFGYLSRAHVGVKVNEVPVSFTWLTDFSVQVTPAPAAGAVVEIRRTTPLDQPAVVWSDGATLTEADMNLDSRFNLYANQESRDANADAVTKNSLGVWDGQGRQTTNFADPTSMTGLVTRNYFENTYTPLLDGKVTEATTQAGIATSAASTAQGYALAADDSADQAAALLAIFKGQYLGAQATAPSVDGNGQPLTPGDLYFNTTEGAMKVRTSIGTWVNAGSTIQGTINTPTAPVIATAGQTTVGVPGGYDSGYILVFLNGAKVDQPDVDTSSGADIVFTSPLAAGDEVTWVAFGAFNVANVNSTNVSFSRTETGAVATKVQDKLLQNLNVFDFFTAAQINDVKSRTASLDVRAAIQNAFNAVKATGGRLTFPAGKYRITGYIGTQFTNPTDTCDNTELHFLPGAEIFLDPNYTIPSGTWFWHAISMEGNNVAVTGNLKLRSNQTLYWNRDLPSQRTNYLQGVILGGKGYGHLTMAIGQEREGVRIEGVDISDFHLPIVAEQARRVKILNCKVANDTDTGILVENCLDDVEVAGNRCINSGDDHFFARHYATTPWAIAGWRVGDYKVHHNHFENNYAKFIGFGGISDVDCHNNYGINSWWAGINVETDNTWYDNSRRIKIHDNTLIECGRSWDPAHPNPTYRVPVTDTSVTCGVLLTTSPAPWPLKRFEHVEIYNNTIINPQSHAISVLTAFNVKISGNLLIPGIVTKNSTNYPTTGAGILAVDVNRCAITDNSFLPDSGGTAWPYCYDIQGDTKTQRVKIMDNPNEEWSTAMFVPPSATIHQQTSYEGLGISHSQDWAGSSIPAGGSLPVVLSCAGARAGDMVDISYSVQISGLTLTAYVNTNDLVVAVWQNSTGSPVNPGAGTYRMRCTRRGIIV